MSESLLENSLNSEEKNFERTIRFRKKRPISGMGAITILNSGRAKSGRKIFA